MMLLKLTEISCIGIDSSPMCLTGDGSIRNSNNFCKAPLSKRWDIALEPYINKNDQVDGVYLLFKGTRKFTYDPRNGT